MKIKEFAGKLGLTESAVRYYEKVGVLPPIGRSTSGHREFDDADLLWMGFVHRLKVTGMPIEKIVEYARLRESGDSTIAKRLTILESHEQRILQELSEKELHLQRLREKISHYKNRENTLALK